MQQRHSYVFHTLQRAGESVLSLFLAINLLCGKHCVALRTLLLKLRGKVHIRLFGVLVEHAAFRLPSLLLLKDPIALLLRHTIEVFGLGVAHIRLLEQSEELKLDLRGLTSEQVSVFVHLVAHSLELLVESGVLHRLVRKVTRAQSLL